MAVLNLSLGEVVEDCPNVTIPDTTDYAENLVFPYSQFKFHDYTGANPTANETFSFSALVFGSYNFTTVNIDVETDGTGNLINAETQYIAFVADINAENDNIGAELIKPDGTGFKDWYVRIFSYDNSFAGLTTSITATSTTVGATITPLTSNISSANAVSVRTLTLYSPDGNIIDLNAVKQVDNLTLSENTYTVGETFTVDFCGNSVDYVVTSDNSAECVAKGIAEAVSAVTGDSNLLKKYVKASYNNGVVTFTSTEAGVPLGINVTYTGSGTFGYSTVTDNVPSMGVPNSQNLNAVVYKTAERGGRYTAVLTVVSGCDYNVVTREFLSWCYDTTNFDCCFIKLLSKDECCSKKKTTLDDACTIQNVIKAIKIMKENNYADSEIQAVVDLGHSICSSSECNCGC